MKLRFVYQLESNDCGPACLAMVADFHGRNYDLKTIKDLCSVTRMGVSVKDILDGARKIGFEVAGLKLQTKDLTEIPLPAILFWKQDHFIVLYKIKIAKDKVTFYLADPAYGKIKLDTELFEREWLGNNPKGVAIVLQNSGMINGQPETARKHPHKNPVADFIRQITAFIKQHRVGYTLSFLLLLIGLGANWALPFIFKKIIDNGIIGKSISVVWALLLAQFALFLGNFSSQLFSDLVLTRLNFRLSILLKQNFLKKLIKLPVSYFDTRLNTDTLQRLSDLSKVQAFLTWKGLSLLINVLNIVVFSTILLFLNKLIFFIFVALSIASIFWVAYFLKRRAALEYSMFIQQSENSNILYEFVMNMPEIKVNRAQDTLINKISAIQKKLNGLELRSLFLNMYQLTGANFILKLKELITIAICAYLIIHSKMTVGALLGISYIMGQLSGPIINLINNIRDGQDADISNKRVSDVYGVKNEVTTTEIKNTPPVRVEDIRLQNVSFKYPGSFNPFVLDNISFCIPKNKVTAIVGTSGSGKTTLMKLLLSYYMPEAGNIYLGAHSLPELNPDDWREKCGVVLQDGHIFSGTVAYNIALSEYDNINMEKLQQAIKIACLEEFIHDLPMGVNTKIGSIGMQLSGGQKQRILIARAVYKDPQLVFFDEATSSLDANNEKSIMNNLDLFFSGRTVLIIAHRLSTVKNADQIIVLERGRIIETGNHHELISKKDRYFSLVKNQLELGN